MNKTLYIKMKCLNENISYIYLSDFYMYKYTNFYMYNLKPEANM